MKLKGAHIKKVAGVGPQQQRVDVRAPSAVGDPQRPRYDEAFVVRYPSGELAARRKYRILRPNGDVIEGLTDGEGRTALVVTDSPEQLSLELLPDPP